MLMFVSNLYFEFVDILYGREKVSNGHFTVIKDTGVTEEDIYNNNVSDDGDVKLEPPPMG